MIDASIINIAISLALGLFFLLLLIGFARFSQANEIHIMSFDRRGEPVADVIIYATSVLAEGTGAGSKKVALAAAANERVQISSYVTPVRLGTTIELSDYDRLEHFASSFTMAQKLMVKSYDRQDIMPAALFNKKGVVVIYNLMRQWVKAFVYIVDTPYFSKTDFSGFARIQNLPVGEYRIEAWHPNLMCEKPLQQSILLGPQTVNLKFQFNF